MQKNTKALWASCQKYFLENVPQGDYECLFAHVQLETFRVADQTLILQVPSAYIFEQIESRYFELLRKAIINTFGRIRLDWHVVVVNPETEAKGKTDGIVFEGNDDTLAPKPIEPEPELIKAPGSMSTRNLPPIDSQLNPRQVFRTFIEGDSNKLSRSVGLSIAEHPISSQFNPMFIFGPSGCGKTHLVNAMGNRSRELYPDLRVLYVSARVFQAQYVNANQQSKINDFIAFYQTIDMLIVDDIQEWMSAPKTQDTFFHIFNHLYRNNRRIILVSDRAPVDLEGMNHRLLTRFAWGLTAEMEKPNVQLCIDILKKKIARDGLSVPDDVVDYIARSANGSVRDLEGIVNSLMAYSIVYRCNIDMRLVERVVKRAVKNDDTPLTVDDILDRVCRAYEVTPNAVKSRSRKRELVIPRQLTMFLSHKYTNIPATRIGRMIGSRDHSTVLHSIAQMEKKIKTDKSFAAEVTAIIKALKIKS